MLVFRCEASGMKACRPGSVGGMAASEHAVTRMRAAASSPVDLMQVADPTLPALGIAAPLALSCPDDVSSLLFVRGGGADVVFEACMASQA